jgi:hypothetical protein
LKVAPLSPPSKPSNVVHVRTVDVTPNPLGFAGIVHTPEIQMSASSWLNDGVQSDGSKPLTGWEKSLPHIGDPKVKEPSAVGVADVVPANNVAARKMAVCDFIVSRWLR